MGVPNDMKESEIHGSYFAQKFKYKRYSSRYMSKGTIYVHSSHLKEERLGLLSAVICGISL